MPDALEQRGALDAARRARGVRLAERTDLGKIDLRGDPADRAFMAAVGRCLDIRLPIEPCTSAGKGRITVLWQGPDGWLVLCPAADVTFFMNSLREGLGDAHAAITDVSDARIAIRVAGPSARDVLAKGCPLDLHPRAFKPGTAAGSRLAKTAVVVHLVEDDPRTGATFDVYIARSFAHYLWAWLADAGLEYGVQVEAAP